MAPYTCDSLPLRPDMYDYELIHSSVCRYNGLLGEYAVNNHNISVQFMRKFLVSHQLAKTEWPALMSTQLIDILTPHTTQRGTLSAVGNDIMDHANYALANTMPSDRFSLHSSVVDGCTNFESHIQLNGRESFYLSEFEYGRLTDFYESIFPAGETPKLLRRVELVKSLCYYGEHFQSDNSDRVNCNIIRARWLKAAYPLCIDLTEKFARAGFINRIIITKYLLAGIVRSIILFDMEWLSMHDDPYSFGNHVQVYHKSSCEPGRYSFLPIQRILSKCAIKSCRHDNINVNVIIPLTGKWAL